MRKKSKANALKQREGKAKEHRKPNIPTAPTSIVEQATVSGDRSSLKARKSLETLRAILGLTHTTECRQLGLDDAVLMSIDLEGLHAIKPNYLKSPRSLDVQVGVAIFDTRNLDVYPCDHELIPTHNFVSGTQQYVARAQSNLLFGTTVVSPNLEEAVARVRQLIPAGRKVVLVGQGMQQDLNALKYLGFDISAHAAWKLDTLQTTQAIWGPLDLHKGDYSLKGILNRLALPFKSLHCGANDANFTLRAALLLAARKVTESRVVRDERRAQIVNMAALRGLESLESELEGSERPTMQPGHTGQGDQNGLTKPQKKQLRIIESSKRVRLTKHEFMLFKQQQEELNNRQQQEINSLQQHFQNPQQPIQNPQQVLQDIKDSQQEILKEIIRQKQQIQIQEQEILKLQTEIHMLREGQLEEGEIVESPRTRAVTRSQTRFTYTDLTGTEKMNAHNAWAGGVGEVDW